MSAPPEIRQLVERFQRHREAYRSGQYNETQLRREFVDPLFKALGWDVDNEQGYAEAYKDVIHEASLKVGGSTKAPDYCFRIGGVRKYFVETKKPSVNLKRDPEPAYQLRRYAWSAKLPLSVLTDFEEFCVYNCRVRPHKTDKASKERVLYITCDEYLDRWDEIASIFSREAILRGAFDKYADSKKKRGTAEVDEAFLKEIETWRELLARNLALRNPNLSQRELNYAVQKTIDRIIFLRICEDRGIELPDRLRGVTNGPSIYPRLCELFRAADDKYNSGLFHFHREHGRPEQPDEWTLELTLDDKPLKDIITGLYYPDSPYEFSVLPADILGQVYEQFLGKVIRLTKGHRAVVEEKPEVRKAGGVYYTPTYIVDYIVQHTVGKLLEGKTAFEVAARTKTWRPSKKGGRAAAGGRPLAILDPACGSGSFLIGAYQYLLDWYRDWYANNDPAHWLRLKEPTIYETTASPQPDETASSPQRQQGPLLALRAPSSYRLTTAEKKRILLDHIYGVDIDPQAVEVTKLSLLLKVLEGENRETLQRQLFAKERALPDLGNNIKCGNSLIGPDFYEGRQRALFDDEERLRINAFDWQREFPQIFSTGDVSTPKSGDVSPTSRDRQGADQPLADARGSSNAPGFDAVIGNPPYGSAFGKPEAEYFSQHYEVFAGVKDVYTCFLEKALALLEVNGRVSMIVPSAWLGGPQYRRLRQHLLQYRVETLLLTPFDVFSAAYVDTVVVAISKSSLDEAHRARTYAFPKREKLTTIDLRDDDYKWVRQLEWTAIEDHKFVLDPGALFIVGRLKTTCSEAFGDIVLMKRGVLFDKSLLHDSKASKNDFLYFEGDVYRYDIRIVANRWIEFGEKMKERPKETFWFEGSRILMRRLVNRRQRLMAAFASETFVTNKNLYTIIPKDAAQHDPRFILGVLNSRLISYLYVSQVSQAVKDDFPQVTIKDLLSLPFAERAKVRKSHDRMVELVEDMLSLHRQLPKARTRHEQTALKRQIETTDRQIDRLVYNLYGLTDEEVEIIEDTPDG